LVSAPKFIRLEYAIRKVAGESHIQMREDELKGWRRAKKLKLILAQNPDWADLSREREEDPGWKLEREARPRIKRRTSKS
jgi:hypothetical protein